ncbi:MAG: hypothetical protein ING02_04820 [Roseomonas sp.]|nr:hypothetical protein [Roseomonas sp.]
MRWIATDNIYAATWRELFDYTNNDLTVKKLIKRHGEPKSAGDKANYFKQANQARVCVLQAKEYMDAAQASSIFTSPNHIYYSIYALASLMMLIMGDGTKSLDYLRKDRNNRNHGLSFMTHCGLKNASVDVNLLKLSSVAISEHGHFPNWYKSLPNRQSVYAIFERTMGGFLARGMHAVGGSTLAPISSISDKRWSLLNLLSLFPDLDSDLRKCGVEKIRSRTSLTVSENDEEQMAYVWRIHGCENKQDLEILLKKFAVQPGFENLRNFTPYPSGLGGELRVNFQRGDHITFEWPDVRETLEHSTISYADHVEMFEIVELYLVAYQLSMLSRYFPDLWVYCIESQCLSAKLISRATEIIGRKFPILCLSILNDEKTVISIYRQPWLE